MNLAFQGRMRVIDRSRSGATLQFEDYLPKAEWVVVRIMVACWVPTIIRHLIFRVPKKGP